MGRTEDTRVIIETVVQGFSLISELINWISVIAETDSERKKLSVVRVVDFLLLLLAYYILILGWVEETSWR
jgi:hypothetical protein